MTHDEIRALSVVMFGNLDRLRVAAAIGRMTGKPISVKSVAEESGLEYNRTQEQIARFKQGGLLIPDFDVDSRRKDYRATNLSYWASAARLEEELLEAEELI